MDALVGNPADQLGKISEELKAKFDEAGMGAVDAFVDTLDEVMDMVKKGPAKLLETVKDLFDQFKAKMQQYIDNPSSLAPGAGAMAACASWYGNAAAGKLKDLSAEAQDMLERIKSLVSQIKEPMEELGKVIENAMKTLDGTVKKLAKLPGELGKLSNEVKGPEDVAKIDTDPMKKCLDTSGISGPLDALAGLKGPLGDAISAVKAGVDDLIDFLSMVPGKVKGVFDVPTPLCFLQQALLSQAPEAMTTLLDMVENMKKVDMSPMKASLGKVSDEICNLDPSTVSEPVKKFAESAKDSVGNLDKLVTGAKMASGGNPLKSVPGVGKLFG